MNEHEHFARFKRLHMVGMLAEQRIEKPHSHNGHELPKAMQEPLDDHLPEHLPISFQIRETLRRSFLGKGWEHILVNKSVDSVTMPKWIASSILGAVLLFGVSSWWRASDQRDLLIELRTELKMAKEYETERSKQLKDQADMNKVYIDNMTNQLNVIRGMLSQQQLNAITKREN